MRKSKVEDRVALLEASVGGMRSDVAELVLLHTPPSVPRRGVASQLAELLGWCVLGAILGYILAEILFPKGK